MGETVKNLSWQLLHGNWRLKLGPEKWDAMIAEVGGPDVKGTDSLEDVPMEPFNEACLYLDKELGNGDGSLVIDIAKASARAWANMNRSLVNSLKGDPVKMMEIFCDEVHPFFLNDPGASRVVRSDGDSVRVELPNGLVEPFKIGILEGFIELTGANASVEAKGSKDFVVRWSYDGPAPQPSKAALLVNAVRAPFLTATVVPVLVGAAVAFLDGFFDWGLFLLTLVGASLFHLGTNTLNDYYDHKSGADKANATPTPFSGGSRVIQRGLIKPESVRNLAVTFFGLGIALGLYLAWLRGVEILYLGLAGFLIGVLYTAPPVRLAHRGLGELATAAGFGPIVVMGTYFVLAQAWSLEALWASIPLAALIAAVLYINEFPDYNGDAAVGKRTLVVRLGLKRAIRGYAVLVGAAYAAVVAGALLGLVPVLAVASLLSLPLAVKAWGTLKRNYAEPYKLIPANAYTVFLHLATGLLLAASIFAAGVLP